MTILHLKNWLEELGRLSIRMGMIVQILLRDYVRSGRGIQIGKFLEFRLAFVQNTEVRLSITLLAHCRM